MLTTARPMRASCICLGTMQPVQPLSKGESVDVNLQEQLLASQEALKSAKAESARRLKSLQSLQQQVGHLHHTVRTLTPVFWVLLSCTHGEDYLLPGTHHASASKHSEAAFWTASIVSTLTLKTKAPRSLSKLIACGASDVTCCESAQVMPEI